MASGLIPRLFAKNGGVGLREELKANDAAVDSIQRASEHALFEGLRQLSGSHRRQASWPRVNSLFRSHYSLLLWVFRNKSESASFFVSCQFCVYLVVLGEDIQFFTEGS